MLASYYQWGWLDVGWHFDLTVLPVAVLLLAVGVRHVRRVQREERERERAARRARRRAEYEKGRKEFLEAARGPRHLTLVYDREKEGGAR